MFCPAGSYFLIHWLTYLHSYLLTYSLTHSLTHSLTEMDSPNTIQEPASNEAEVWAELQPDSWSNAISSEGNIFSHLYSFTKQLIEEEMAFRQHDLIIEVLPTLLHSLTRSLS